MTDFKAGTGEDALIQQTLKGSTKAAGQLLESIQAPVYNLAVRFFWDPADAQDATQEILLRVLTKLNTFKGQSKFSTWVYRVATNYLLNARRRQTEQLTFEEGAMHLSKGMTYGAYQGADEALLEEEVKIACSTSMLVCLSRPMRMAYLVGEILAFNGQEAGYILDISPATFRKRLSLARKSIRGFMGQQCGLYNTANPCRCKKQINYCVAVKWFAPGQLKFADKGKINAAKQEIEMAMNDAAIFSSHPDYVAPKAALNALKALLKGGKLPLLTGKA